MKSISPVRLLLLAAMPTALFAVPIPIDMPAGARSWIEAAANSSTHEVGAVGTLPTTRLPMVAGREDHSMVVSADTGPGFLRASNSNSGTAGSGLSFDTSFLRTSMVDTFSLHSETLTNGTVVNFSVLMAIDGSAYRESLPIALGAGQISGVIGEWNPSTDVINESAQRVSYAARADKIFSRAGTPLSESVHLEVVYGLTGFVGTDFDLGFQLNINAWNMNLGADAAISFLLPDDIYITSASGFSQGAPDTGSGGGGPSTSVPDGTSTGLLLLIAASILAGARPRPSLTSITTVDA